MSDGGWHRLISDFVERRIDERAFHDGFFELWHAAQKANQHVPSPVETLFYVVEAYCPDPALRDSDSLYEADDAELRDAAGNALPQLVPQSRFRMLLNRMKP